jgi:hypothetical protein
MSRPDFQDGVAFLPDRGRAAYRPSGAPERQARERAEAPGLIFGSLWGVEFHVNGKCSVLPTRCRNFLQHPVTVDTPKSLIKPLSCMRHSNLPSFMCRKFLQSCQSCDNTSKLGEIDKSLIM